MKQYGAILYGLDEKLLVLKTTSLSNGVLVCRPEHLLRKLAAGIPEQLRGLASAKVSVPQTVVVGYIRNFDLVLHRHRQHPKRGVGKQLLEIATQLSSRGGALVPGVLLQLLRADFEWTRPPHALLLVDAGSFFALALHQSDRKGEPQPIAMARTAYRTEGAFRRLAEGKGPEDGNGKKRRSTPKGK